MSRRGTLLGFVAGLLMVCGCGKGIPEGGIPGEPQVAGRGASEAEAEGEPKVLKVKGLYLGMSLDEAKEQLAQAVKGTKLAERWASSWQKKQLESSDRFRPSQGETSGVPFLPVWLPTACAREGRER